MAGETDKAAQQNAIRREQKRKQRVGRGKRPQSREIEVAKLSRHVRGDWSAETKTLLTGMMMEENRLVTGRSLAKLMFDGKLSVVVKDSENPMINEKVFRVTKEGFIGEDGNPPGYKIYSITVPVGNGYGFQMRWDKSGRMFVG